VFPLLFDDWLRVAFQGGEIAFGTVVGFSAVFSTVSSVLSFSGMFLYPGIHMMAISNFGCSVFRLISEVMADIQALLVCER
jgi:hypothetical protein